MATSDILLPESGETRTGFSRSLIVAFVPIAVALLGVGAILLGGVSARGPAAEAVAAGSLDPVTTGSIAAPTVDRRAMELLDR